MKTLTKILGVIAITGALAGFAGYVNKNETIFAHGAIGLTVGGVGYILAKSKENEQDTYIHRK
jgi:hypothetical protein